jgi:hypothetical protein
MAEPPLARVASQSSMDPEMDDTLQRLMSRFELTVDSLLDASLGPLLESTQSLDRETARNIARQTMLERFREELGRLGAAGALTPPASVAGSDSDGEEPGGEELNPDEYGEEEGEEWEEEWDEEGGGDGQDWGQGDFDHWGAQEAETMSQYASRTAMAAMLAGADPLEAADAAVEASLRAEAAQYDASAAASGRCTPEPDVANAQAAQARMEALALRAAAAEEGAASARARMNSTLTSLGFTPKDVTAPPRRSAEAAPKVVRGRNQPRVYALTSRASQLEEDGDGSTPTLPPVTSATTPATPAVVVNAAAVAAAAAAAAAAARLGSSQVRVPALASLMKPTSAPLNVEPRRMKPGGLMPPPEEKPESSDSGLGGASSGREHVDRRDLDNLDALMQQEAQVHPVPPQSPRRPNFGRTDGARSPSPVPMRPDSPKPSDSPAGTMRREKSWSRMC